MELLMLRHGQTQGNLEKRYIGKTDEALCQEGIACAQAAFCDKTVQHVYVSPLLRARQTAEICFPAAMQTVVENLREMDFGDFEGKTYLDMAEDQRYQQWVDGMCEDRCPNGESKAEATRRVAVAVQAILADAQAAGENRVIIVAHGGTIMAAFDAFGPQERSYFDWQVGNCCGYIATVEFTKEGQLRLLNPRLLKEDRVTHD